MTNFTFDVNTGGQVLSRADSVPLRIVQNDLISNTSEAYECYTKQKFSASLQAYMVSYVISVSSYYSNYM